MKKMHSHFQISIESAVPRGHLGPLKPQSLRTMALKNLTVLKDLTLCLRRVPLKLWFLTNANRLG